MSKIKKIIEGGLEFTKDSAKQLTKAISPAEMVKQALGQQPKNEFTEYLKTVGKDLTPEEYEKKKQEYEDKAKKEEEEAKKVIAAALPPHMRLPQKQKELRPQEKMLQEEKMKEAQQIEAMKKKPQPVITPVGKPQSGSLFAKRKSATKGFEGLQKDTKVG